MSKVKMFKVDYRKIRWGEELPSDWQPPEILKLIHDIRHKMDNETKRMEPKEIEAHLSKKRRHVLGKLGYKMLRSKDGGYKLVKIDK